MTPAELLLDLAEGGTGLPDDDAPRCACCGERRPGSWCSRCRSHVCFACDETTVPDGFGCTRCWEITKEYGDWFVLGLSRWKYTRESLHLATCPFPTCSRSTPHRHVIGLQTEVVTL